MEKSCYTLVIKAKFHGDGSTVGVSGDTPAATPSADGGGGGGSSLTKAVDGSNVGHKLLKMMGWSGVGGLGKGGQGISEPITASSVTNRQGLGAQKLDTHFKQRMQALLQDYANSTNPYDLIFSSDFAGEQRAEIHT